MKMVKITSMAIVIFGLFFGLITVARAKLDCEKRDTCSCKMTDGSGIVDLTSLGNTDDTPRFTDVECDEDEWYYSYNPCGGFDEQQCSGVALCGLTEDKAQATPLGQADKVQFTYDSDSGNVQAGYLIPGTPIMTSEIEMVCDTSACEPQFVPLGKHGGSFKMQLTTICACPGMCTESGPTQDCVSKTSLSTGTLILIGFASCLVAYLAIGISYQKFKKRASGQDLIPNKALWGSLIICIKDGFSLVFCNVRRRDMQVG